MTDKEVGQLWHWHVKQLSVNGFGNSDVICNLISKLVEERKRWHEVNCLSDDCTFQHKTGYNHENDALKDFGIDLKI